LQYLFIFEAVVFKSMAFWSFLVILVISVISVILVILVILLLWSLWSLWSFWALWHAFVAHVLVNDAVYSCCPSFPEPAEAGFEPMI
jgi:hypothetical protein